MLILVWLVLIGVARAACSPNCLLCDTARNVCYSCPAPLNPIVGGSCLPVSEIGGCLLYLSNGICARCQLGYRPITGNQCERDRSGCIRFGAGGTCLECGFGTQLLYGGCTGLLNCLVYSKKTTKLCVQCYNGYVSFDIFCIANTGCSTANTTTGVCTECRPGFRLSGFNCYPSNSPKIPGCSVYASTGECLYCQEGLNSTQLRVCSIANPDNINVSLFNLTVATGYSIPANILPNSFSLSTTPEKTIKSDPNCEAFDSLEICVSCNPGYYLGMTKCEQASPNCDGFNILNGDCLGCVPGYALAPNGKCFIIRKIDSNCNILSKVGTCVICKYGFYLLGGLCTPVSTLCIGYNLLTGGCLKCPSSYINNNGTCQPDVKTVKDTCLQRPSQQICLKCITGYRLLANSTCELIFVDPNCKQFVNDQCKACSKGYYLNRQFACAQINPLCANYDLNNGFCLSCYSGYKLVGSSCLIDGNGSAVAPVRPAQPPSRTPTRVLTSTNGTPQTTKHTMQFDPNCAYSALNGECITCAYGYYQSDYKCLQSNLQCKTYDLSNGECLTCYDGYDLRNQGSCVDVNLVDPNCVHYTNSTCTQCIRDFYVNTTGKLPKCVPVSSACEVFEPTTGVCKGCRIGFKVSSVDPRHCVDENCMIYNGDECQTCRQPFFLFNNTCTIVVILPKEPRNCAVFQNSVCSSCIPNYFLRNGSCIKASPLCATVDPRTGFCLSCYSGYTLNAGSCVITQIQAAPVTTTTPAAPVTSAKAINDTNCKIKGDQACKECYPGYWLNTSICQAVNSQCQTFDNLTGYCTSCYPGYALTGRGECKIPVDDPNCNNNVNGKCLACKESFSLGADGTCSRQINLCATIDKATGKCATCFPGYKLVDSKCVVQFVPSMYCKKNDGKVCLECANGFFIKNGDCQQVSTLCEKFNNVTGDCTSCFTGYQLIGGTCQIASKITKTTLQQQLAQQTAASLSAATGSNTTCKQGMYFNGKACIAVSILCLQFDFGAKRCLSCQLGTILQDGDCLMPSLGVDVNCLRYTNSYCSSCASGYFIENFVCTKVDADCKKFNSASNLCQACEKGKQPDGARCV